MKAPEDTKAQVNKTVGPPILPPPRKKPAPKISNPQNLPRLTPKPQPKPAPRINHPENLPRVTSQPQGPKGKGRLTPKPDNRMITPHPHPHHEKHDYSHSGGRALNATRANEKSHRELVAIARQVLNSHANGIRTGTNEDDQRQAAQAKAVALNVLSHVTSGMDDGDAGYVAQRTADVSKEEQDKKYSGSVGKLALGAITLQGPVGTAVNKAAQSVGSSLVNALQEAHLLQGNQSPAAIVQSMSGGIAGTGKTTRDIVENAGKELVNLPANVPASLYYAGAPAVEGVATGDLDKASAGIRETGKRLGEPFVNLAKHPGKSLTEHPLSSALMVSGVVKGADRGAGRVEQGAYPHVAPKAGKTTKEMTPAAEKQMRNVINQSKTSPRIAKTLDKRLSNIEDDPKSYHTVTAPSGGHTITTKPSRPYAPIERKLPGTAAKDVVLPRQGAIAYRIQKKSGGESLTKRIRGNPTRMSDARIAQRVDETFYTSVHQARQDAYIAIHQAKKDNPSLNDKQLQDIGKTQLKVSRDHWRDESVKDMALRDKNGRLRTFSFVDGKGGAASAIEKWGQNMINQGRNATMQTYTHGTKGRAYRGARGKDVQTLVPRELKTGPNKGKYVLIPKIAADQLAQHDSYLAQTPLSAVGQAVGGTFRRTVLPFSPKWLSNNYTEAALRGAVNTVGPLSAREAHSVFGKLAPQQAAEWNQLVKSVGHGGMQRQLLTEGTTMADRLEHTKYENVGKAITKFGQTPGPRTAAKLFDKYTDVVFSQLNGHMENSVHMGMAGKVLKRHPLMSQKLVDLTNKAMRDPDGPKTVEARNNLIALGREVDRMFGKYGKFSPAIRRSVATWTPFIPWTLNAVHFITQHLPNDHPIVTALAADAHQAAQEWRNKHGLGYFIDGSLPPFLQGAIPGSNGSHWLIFTQGTPFGVATDPSGTAARGFNPLGQTIINNMNGLDWKGDKIKGANPAKNTETAILSMLEATTPIGYASSRLTSGQTSTNDNLMKWLNPYHPVKGKQAQSSSKTSKPAGLFSGGGKSKSEGSMFHSSSSGNTPSLFGP